MAQKESVCRRVIVKKDGDVVLRWTSPFIGGALVVSRDADRLIIIKNSIIGTQTYMPSLDESIETSNSILHWW